MSVKQKKNRWRSVFLAVLCSASGFLTGVANIPQLPQADWGKLRLDSHVSWNRSRSSQILTSLIAIYWRKRKIKQREKTSTLERKSSLVRNHQNCLDSFFFLFACAVKLAWTRVDVTSRKIAVWRRFYLKNEKGKNWKWICVSTIFPGAEIQIRTGNTLLLFRRRSRGLAQVSGISRRWRWLSFLCLMKSWSRPTLLPVNPSRSSDRQSRVWGWNSRLKFKAPGWNGTFRQIKQRRFYNFDLILITAPYLSYLIASCRLFFLHIIILFIRMNPTISLFSFQSSLSFFGQQTEKAL